MSIFDKHRAFNVSMNENYDRKNEERFSKYIESLSSIIRLKIFNNEYDNLKGASNLRAYTGQNIGIEFIGAVLLWRYANDKLNDNRTEFNKYGPLIIRLADVLGFIFNFCDPQMWSDRLNIVIKNSSDVISITEWGDVCRCIETDMIKLSGFYSTFDFCMTKSQSNLAYRNTRFNSFASIYNELPDYKSTIDYYTSQKLGFCKDIWFKVEN